MNCPDAHLVLLPFEGAGGAPWVAAHALSKG